MMSLIVASNPDCGEQLKFSSASATEGGCAHINLDLKVADIGRGSITLFLSPAECDALMLAVLTAKAQIGKPAEANGVEAPGEAVAPGEVVAF